jgi:hypothetical protein
MKDNQHEQLFTELNAEFKAPAFKELDDEVAATCIGGAALTLYEHGNFNRGQDARNLKVNRSINNVGGFNDLTSSFIISEGRWAFYADENYEKHLFTRGPGRYAIMPPNTNDRVTSVKRIA